MHVSGVVSIRVQSFFSDNSVATESEVLVHIKMGQTRFSALRRCTVKRQRPQHWRCKSPGRWERETFFEGAFWLTQSLNQALESSVFELLPALSPTEDADILFFWLLLGHRGLNPQSIPFLEIEPLLENSTPYRHVSPLWQLEPLTGN